MNLLPVANVLKVENGILVTYSEVNEVKDHARPDRTQDYLDAALSMMKQHVEGEAWNEEQQEVAKKIKEAEKAQQAQAKPRTHWEVREVTTFCQDHAAVLAAVTLALAASEKIAELNKAGLLTAGHYIGGMR